jgi:hypothetical protein
MSILELFGFSSMLGLSYGGGGGSGGGISYGPVFWIVAAIVVLVVIGLGVWLVRRSRARRTPNPAGSSSDRGDRAA